MPNLFTLPMLAALAVGGTASGLYLGRSAIAEIDPVYFAPAFSPDRFHADLVPGGANFDSASPADIQNIALTGGYGFGDGCVNCRTYPEEYVPEPDPAAAAYFGETPVDAILDDVDRQIDGAQRAASETIERYAHYRVSDDEPEEEAEPVNVHRGAVVQVAANDAPAQAEESRVVIVGADLQQ